MLIVYRVMLHLKPGSMINDKMETYFAFDNNTFKNSNKFLTCYKQYVTYYISVIMIHIKFFLTNIIDHINWVLKIILFYQYPLQQMKGNAHICSKNCIRQITWLNFLHYNILTQHLPCLQYLFLSIIGK